MSRCVPENRSAIGKSTIFGRAQGVASSVMKRPDEECHNEYE
jgi:hypothetical protein